MIATFARIFGKKPKTSVAEYYARLLGPCALCQQIPIDHLYWRLASAVCSKVPNRVVELEELVSGRHWREATAIQDWEGLEDEVEFIVLKCPLRGGVVLKKMLSVFEMFLDDQHLADVPLDAADASEIGNLAVGQWRRLDGNNAG